MMFTGLTAATLLGVPAGAWLGLQLGWRSVFWAVTLIGAFAFAVIAAFVPKDRQQAGEKPSPLRDEVAAVLRPQVLRGLAMTVFGFAGVFTTFTYIQPLLTRIGGFSEAAVSPILLVFGGGLAVGNLLGGRLADRALMPAVVGTLAALAAMTWALGTPWLAVVAVGLLGVAAFATVAPMQLRVLEQASGAGQNLASSLNIAAFNLGNALGAWLGGVTVDRGPGLQALGYVAALVTLAGLGIALWSRAADGAPARPLPARA
jgi:MFS transporter, DHA1 family, inner membrane transport protein